jgi:type II secretory pathway pseudopilin PulG
VVIISILIGGVFQLMNTIGQSNEKARTLACLQRLQNAISGFYAEYGYYPPVPNYTSPDPWGQSAENDFGGGAEALSSENGFREACSAACRSQPIAFEFPNPQGQDSIINMKFQQDQIQSPNTLLGGQAASIPKDEWNDVKMFKFGLLSFLVPRVEVIGFAGPDGGSSDIEPKITFYESRQWKKNNPASKVSDTRKALAAQQIIENRAVARWLPNLEGLVQNGTTILGVNTRGPGSTSGSDLGGFRTWLDKDGELQSYSYNGQKYVLKFLSVVDGWDREIYYYSQPPYQSFCIWSAGKDGRTFPPWIKLNALSGKEREWAAKWAKDDIVRFDR